ncbi:MAG: HAD family hydrolase [Coriobacteriia bacterium]
MKKPPLLADSPAALEALARAEILYTDLDGTLLGPGGTLLADGEGAPSAATAKAIVALNRAGLPVVPVSGRSRIQMTEIVRLCGWNDFIAEAGAMRTYFRNGTREVIFDTPEWPLYRRRPSRTPLDEIDDSGACERLLAAFPERIEYHDPWHLGREATAILRGSLDARAAQKVLDEIDLPLDFIDNGLIRLRTSPTLSCDPPLHAYHIVPRGVSKRRSIDLDLASRGLVGEQAAFIGDSGSDVEAATVASVVALVANAAEDPLLVETASAFENVVLLGGKRGDGWAEFANAWLQARQDRARQDRAAKGEPSDVGA